MSNSSDGQFSDYEEDISAKVKTVRVSILDRFYNVYVVSKPKLSSKS